MTLREVLTLPFNQTRIRVVCGDKTIVRDETSDFLYKKIEKNNKKSNVVKYLDCEVLGFYSRFSIDQNRTSIIPIMEIEIDMRKGS